jgi:hypothetical protein
MSDRETGHGIAVSFAMARNNPLASLAVKMILPLGSILWSIINNALPLLVNGPLS